MVAIQGVYRLHQLFVDPMSSQCFQKFGDADSIESFCPSQEKQVAWRMAYLCFLLDPSDDVNGFCRTFPLPESEECCREVAARAGLDTFPQQGGIEFVQRAKEGDRTIIIQLPGVSLLVGRPAAFL